MAVIQQLGIAYNPIIASPTLLPNLQIWYNADIANATNFGTSVPTNGGTVTKWVDRSGTGHDANQSGNATFKPKWYSNVKAGLGAIRYNGTAESLNINPLTGWGLSLSGFTMFVVARSLSLTGTPVMTASDTGGFQFFYNGIHWGTEAGGGNAVSTTGATGDTTNFHIYAQVFDGTATGNENRLKFRYDGVQQTLQFNTNVNATTSANATYIYLGTDRTGAANYWNGEMAEIIMFTRTLNASEIDMVEEYLKNHWKI